MSRSGRWLLLSEGNDRKLIDLAGTMPQRGVDLGVGTIARFIGRELWAINADGLTRIGPTNLRALSPTLQLPGPITNIMATGGSSLAEGLLVGNPTLRVGLRGDAVVLEVVSDVRPGEQLLAAVGGRLYLASDSGMRALERVGGA
ncbi:MAG TPA: hypothetical protein VK034_04275 [Enhygromyxa sp.]|nr:hypothetical protein [Enhygromyxa sp.]